MALILARLFNEAVCKGFCQTWTLNTIIPIHEVADPMDPSNYKTIMIGHVRSTFYDSVLDGEVSGFVEARGLRAEGHASFRAYHAPLDHTLTLKEEARYRRQKIYCCFVDFHKAFDIVPWARLIIWLHDLGYSHEIICAVVALTRGFQAMFAQVRDGHMRL